jgi:hypothetical protein
VPKPVGRYVFIKTNIDFGDNLLEENVSIAEQCKKNTRYMCDFVD